MDSSVARNQGTQFSAYEVESVAAQLARATHAGRPLQALTPERQTVLRDIARTAIDMAREALR